MKRMMLLLAFCGMLTAAMADWTYGTAHIECRLLNYSYLCNILNIIM